MKLSHADVDERMKRLTGWTLQGDEIRKQYTFKGFPEAIAFVNRLAPEAEAADHHPDIYASIGVHPHEVKHIADGWYDELRRLAQNQKVVAYGEIGLDYHYNHSTPKEQRERFREQVQLARELRLPVIIHTREAQEDTISILKEEKAAEVGGVFHCFSGDAWLAKDALDLGFYLSFSGILTFQNASMLRDIAKQTPLDRVLIETDCPYLTPVPHRGKRNEPAFVSHVAQQLAEIHPELSLDQISQATTENAKRLFTKLR